jgi:REP element-mobilizing transposase RayT
MLPASPEAMTAPRQVLRGTAYLVTRRCAQRQYLLKPTRTTREVCRYLLGVAAQRYGVRLHAYCFLSNHYHLVVTDPQGRLPAFLQFFDALVARALNAHLGRSENFWAPDAVSAVALGSPRDVVDKAGYTLANPVAAGLVRSTRQWPGLWSAPDAIGAGAVSVRRPAHFFAEAGSLPDVIDLEIVEPPATTRPGEFREQVAAALAWREADAVRQREGLGFLGAARVLARPVTARPRTGETMGGLRPQAAARRTARRVEMLRGLADFVNAYRCALGAWRRGDRETRFPEGTYLMRVLHGALCIGAG